MLVSIVTIYVVVQLLIGYWASKKVHSEKDYLLAGRTLGITLTSFSLFATWFGAETIMGSAASIAEKGLAGGRADPFGYTICLVAMAFLLAYKLRSMNLTTIGDMFRTRYGRSTELLGVFIMVPASIIWSSAQLLAFGQVLSVVGGIDIQVSLILATLVVMIYTSMGGLLGDVLTDFIQGLTLIVGVIILFYFTINNFGGIKEAWDVITPEQLSFVSPGESVLSRLDSWMIPILGSLVSQEALSRMLASKTPKTARNACLIASVIYIFVGMVPAFTALVGTHTGLNLEYRDTFLPSLAQNLLPPVLFAFFMGALVSAILSTVDSTLLTVSSFIEHNLILQQFPNISEKRKVLIARISVVAAALVAYAIAGSGDTIFELVQTASSFGTGGILIIVLLGLWTKLGDKWTGVLTLLTGVGITLLTDHEIITVEAPFITSVLASLTVFIISGLIETKLYKKVHVQEVLKP